MVSARPLLVLGARVAYRRSRLPPDEPARCGQALHCLFQAGEPCLSHPRCPTMLSNNPGICRVNRIPHWFSLEPRLLHNGAAPPHQQLARRQRGALRPMHARQAGQQVPPIVVAPDAVRAGVVNLEAAIQGAACPDAFPRSPLHADEAAHLGRLTQIAGRGQQPLMGW